MKIKQHPHGGPPGLTKRGQQWPPENPDHPGRQEHPGERDHPDHPEHPEHPDHPSLPEQSWRPDIQRAPGPESD